MNTIEAAAIKRNLRRKGRFLKRKAKQGYKSAVTKSKEGIKAAGKNLLSKAKQRLKSLDVNDVMYGLQLIASTTTDLEAKAVARLIKKEMA